VVAVRFALEGHRSALASRGPGDHREITVRYTARLPRLPEDAREIRMWIPLAQTSAEQEIRQRSIRAPGPYRITQEPAYGNEILYLVRRPPWPEGFTVAVDYEARLRGGPAPPDRGSLQPSAERDRTLAAEGLVIIDEEIRARAALATTGRATPRDRARGIYDAVIAQMAYDKEVPGWGRGDTQRACRLGKGNCTDFHSLFISMARAERIPSRFKIGVVIPDAPSGAVSGYHCWAEFYEAGRGWVSVDASEGWKQPTRAGYYFGSWDATLFLISTGRHLDLVPKQQGEPINIFLYPYVEVNGEPWAGVETEVRFQDREQEGTT
jgi:transglutaminase-like putative cysteine protease